MKEKFSGALRACGIETGARVLCACSGGADSTALLRLLWETPGVEVHCAHFNHRLRGPESDRDEAFVSRLCMEWGVPFHAGQADVAEQAALSRKGVEETARALRYRFLLETAAENGCTAVATAHNAEDNAETVLLNLVRGAGTRGLSGIPPVRETAGGIPIVRPLLGFSRQELLDYLREKHLSHMEDSSNATDAYARNRLRHQVMPLLRELNDGAVEHICAAAGLLREDEAYLDGLAAAFLAEQPPEGLSLAGLAALPGPVAMRALRRFAGSPGREHLERLRALCQDGRDGAMLDLPGERFYRAGGLLRRGAPPPVVELPPRTLPVNGCVALPEIGKIVRCGEIVYNSHREIYSSFNTFFFQSEKICGTIKVASRAPGDRMRPAGRNCTKALRRLFAEAGIPPDLRSRVPVFSDELGVIAVAGFGVAERCAPELGKPALRVELVDL